MLHWLFDKKGVEHAMMPGQGRAPGKFCSFHSYRKGSRGRRRWPSLSGMMSTLAKEQLNGKIEAEVAPATKAEEQSDLLGEIVRWVEASCDRWPQRRDVVSCADVCKRWCQVTKIIP